MTTTETPIAPGTPAAFQQGATDAPATQLAPGVIVTEVPGVPAPAASGTRTFTEAEIQAARTQERDKVYPEMKRMQDELKDTRDKLEAREKTEREATEAAANLATTAAQAEMDAKQLITAKDAEWKAMFAQQQAEVDTTRALFEREQRHAQLQAYRFEAQKASAEDVLPELLDFIDGNDVDEINASMETLKQRSAAILGNMNAATQQQRVAMQGTTATAPATGPVDNVMGQQQFSAEDIKNMDEATYAKYRNQLLPAASRLAFGR